MTGPYTMELQHEPGSQVRPVFFKVEVLERFRSDPGYRVLRNSISAQEEAQDSDGIQQFVLARGPAEEYAIMVLVAHLVHLNPKNQRHFHEYELARGRIHPEVFEAIVHGKFPNDIGPLEGLCAALAECNAHVHPARLFRHDDSWRVDRTEEFGPLSYNSRKQFLSFAQGLHDLLGDNLRPDPLDAAAVAKEAQDGRRLGTIQRLESWLNGLGVDSDAVAEIVSVFHKVRKHRQPSAHGIREDESAEDYRAIQDELLQSAVQAVRALATVLGDALRPPYTRPRALTLPVRSLFP